tara:strand:- start:1037 stop:1690 length:654 start_codon:yes stop_codon:yes gene_type:complete
MDPRHPNLAFAANTGALVLVIGLLVSVFLPIGTPRGWGNIETALAILIAVCFGLSWWAKKEHDIPVVHAHGGSFDQYEAMEDLPTMVSLDNTQDLVNPNTAAVIESIIGAESTQEVSAVANAIDTLSSGEIGKSAAAAVAHNEVDHTKVNTESNAPKGFQDTGIVSIPLPTMPALELPDLPAVVDLPDMINLDDLLNEDENQSAPPPLDLPELPDFE